jgi:hypothetical protein
MTIKLKGWNAVAALALIGAFIVGKVMMERSTLETEAAEEIKFWLRADYMSAGLLGFDPAQMTEEEAEARVQELLSLNDIVFTSIRARGRGDDVAVKIEIQVAGKDPPDGKRTRYYRMTHSTLTGWRVKHESTALSYYLKLF